MINCEIIKSSELSKNDENKWREFCAAHSQFQSPILSPEFFHEVAKVRDDVFVAVFRKESEVIAFLSFHRRPNGFARPVGAPFSDYSALITPPNPQIRMNEAMELAGIKKFRAIGWIDPYNVSDDFLGENDEAHAMCLVIEDLPHSASKKHRKNVNRLRRHLSETYGEVKFIFDDKSQEHFDRMIELKRIQTKQTGVHDFLAPIWVQEFIKNLFNNPRDGLHGSMLTMTAGDKPVAWQFGPKLGNRMHPWIFTYEPDYAQYSPGQIYLMDCPIPMRENNVAYNDLSTGAQAYKNTFCNVHFPVKHGTIIANSPSKNQFGTSKIDKIMQKLDRRFDQIACLELDFLGRAKGIGFAVLNAFKRI